METNEEKIIEIRKRMEDGIYLNRVPKRIKTEFISFAKEEFCDDRGMALKFLWDYFTGVYPLPNQTLPEQENETPVLQENKKKKIIRSVSGQVIAELEEKENVEA